MKLGQKKKPVRKTKEKQGPQDPKSSFKSKKHSITQINTSQKIRESVPRFIDLSQQKSEKSPMSKRPSKFHEYSSYKSKAQDKGKRTILKSCKSPSHELKGGRKHRFKKSIAESRSSSSKHFSLLNNFNFKAIPTLNEQNSNLGSFTCRSWHDDEGDT